MVKIQPFVFPKLSQQKWCTGMQKKKKITTEEKQVSFYSL